MKNIPVIKKELLSLVKGQSGMINIIFALCFGVIAVPSGFLLSFIVMPVMFGMSAYSSLNLDESSGWMSYLLSTPIGRKHFVRQKYVATILFAAIGIAYSALLAVLHCLFTGNSLSNILVFIIPMGLFFGLIIPSLCFPLSLKFGVEKGKVINLGLGAILGMLMSMILSASGDMTVLSISAKLAKYDPKLIMLAAAGASAAAVLFSWKLSALFFRKREL